MRIQALPPSNADSTRNDSERWLPCSEEGLDFKFHLDHIRFHIDHHGSEVVHLLLCEAHEYAGLAAQHSMNHRSVAAIRSLFGSLNRELIGNTQFLELGIPSELASAGFWSEERLQKMRGRIPAYRLSKFQDALPDAALGEMLGGVFIDAAGARAAAQRACISKGAAVAGGDPAR